MNTLILLAPFLVGGADPVPADDDVKAGWVAFWIFIGLAVAVVLLGFSLTKHLRKARGQRRARCLRDPRRPSRADQRLLTTS